MLGLGLMFAMGATNAQAQTVTVLHRFGEPGGPLQPQYPGVVAQGRDGALYTTAPNGGAQASGAVFRVTPSGSFNVVYSFTSSGSGGDGYLPRSGLTLGTDGNFYGSSSAGGGTIFKVTPNGNGTGLHSFLYTKDDGLNPYAPPIEGPDGNFYGTTTSNQAKTGSTMYRITPSGDLTTIYSFGFSGSDVVAPLVLGTDGNFYGTASKGGAHGYGSVFKATITGQVTYIYNFDGTNGGYPIAPLIQATDGNFYGTTTIGGDHDDGVVFKLTPAGQITVLHSFNGTDGKTPYAGLVQANDGNFYGAAYEGGTSGYGTLYKIKPQGAFSVLYNFDGMGTGDYPEVTLTQHTNGLFYSDTYITSSGGTGWPGLFYSLNVGLPPFIRLQPSYGTAGASIGIFGQGFTGTQSVTFNGKPARFTVTSDTYLTATAPSGVTTGPVIVTTPGGALTSNISFRSTEVAAPSISAVVSASGFGGFSPGILGRDLRIEPVE